MVIMDYLFFFIFLMCSCVCIDGFFECERTGFVPPWMFFGLPTSQLNLLEDPWSHEWIHQVFTPLYALYSHKVFLLIKNLFAWNRLLQPWTAVWVRGVTGPTASRELCCITFWCANRFPVVLWGLGEENISSEFLELCIQTGGRTRIRTGEP